MALSRIFVAPNTGQRGVKKSFFFQKKYSKDGKKIGDLWDHFWPKSILGVGGVRSTVTSLGAPTSTHTDKTTFKSRKNCGWGGVYKVLSSGIKNSLEFSFWSLGGFE